MYQRALIHGKRPTNAEKDPLMRGKIPTNARRAERELMTKGGSEQGTHVGLASTKVQILTQLLVQNIKISRRERRGGARGQA